MFFVHGVYVVNWNNHGKYDSFVVDVRVDDVDKVISAVWYEIKRKINPDLVISVCGGLV